MNLVQRECAWCRAVYTYDGSPDDDDGWCSTECARQYTAREAYLDDQRRGLNREPYPWEDEGWDE